MSYNYDWDKILDIYVKRIATPDGRDTFESTTELVSDIIKIAELRLGGNAMADIAVFGKIAGTNAAAYAKK